MQNQGTRSPEDKTIMAHYETCTVSWEIFFLKKYTMHIVTAAKQL